MTSPIRNLDLSKAGSNLYDPAYTPAAPACVPPSASNVSGGPHRASARTSSGSGSPTRSSTASTTTGSFGAQWSGDPACTGPPARRDFRAVCSKGPMYFDTSIGRERYARIAHPRSRLACRKGRSCSRPYTFGSYVGSNGTGTGTSGASQRARLRVQQRRLVRESTGRSRPTVATPSTSRDSSPLPWGNDVGVSQSPTAATPMTPYVRGMDFNGDGRVNDLLPGTTVNQFGRGRSTRATSRNWSRTTTSSSPGRVGDGGQTASRLTLPADYYVRRQLLHAGPSVDSKAFEFEPPPGSRIIRVRRCLSTCSTRPISCSTAVTSRDRFSFGQPGGRSSQVFRSGGPRAVQFGARVGF